MGRQGDFGGVEKIPPALAQEFDLIVPAVSINLFFLSYLLIPIKKKGKGNKEFPPFLRSPLRRDSGGWSA
jgi:hypothetical protein